MSESQDLAKLANNPFSTRTGCTPCELDISAEFGLVRCDSTAFFGILPTTMGPNAMNAT